MMNLGMRAALAALACSVCGPAWGQASGFGDFAMETLRPLVIDFPGRTSGSAAFAGASDLMERRFTLGGLDVKREDFRTRANRPSQNVIGTIAGASQDFILVGAHFDAATARLQGVDDNGSGAAVLTELAAHLSGLELETGLVFNAFGAEETGLEGSDFYRRQQQASGEIADLKGMINIDSLVTGDFMYAHAGTNYLADPALKSYWTRVHAIAGELGIDLRSNPGLNPDYPIDTGCCSDGASFESLDIPVLWLESTNWDIGDLDGYTQTANPLIPGGATWHDPAEDNWAFLEAALGTERIPDRLAAYSQLLTHLLLQLSGADLAASARSGAAISLGMADQLMRQNEAFQAAADRATLRLLAMRPAVGEVGGSAFVEGLWRPKGTFDADAVPGEKEIGGRIALRGDYQYSALLGLGADLHLSRSRDDLADGSDLDATTVALGLDLLISDGTPPWLAASLSGAYTRFDGTRDFLLRSGLGATLVDGRFGFDADATTLGARVEGGYDFSVAGIATGPVAGLSYVHYRIDAFREGGGRRTALGYDAQSFDSLEGELGWRVRGRYTLSDTIVLSPYGRIGFVRDFTDGRPGSAGFVALADGSARTVSFAALDRSFGRASLGAELAFDEAVSTFVEIGTRFAHDDGEATSLSFGLGVTF